MQTDFDDEQTVQKTVHHHFSFAFPARSLTCQLRPSHYLSEELPSQVFLYYTTQTKKMNTCNISYYVTNFPLHKTTTNECQCLFNVNKIV